MIAISRNKPGMLMKTKDNVKKSGSQGVEKLKVDQSRSQDATTITDLGALPGAVVNFSTPQILDFPNFP
jgi:hypothetical protein